MQPIEIIVIVASVLIVGGIITWRIIRRIKSKGKPECCEECAKINYKKIAKKVHKNNEKKNQLKTE
ncbi:MAG: hypothetical protein LBV55_01135 [Acholeplasmatales bacterium]|jgi:predicted negative regulator of RcsB-dependent stress response|nr:hypothetical protein [Acholeplasmatales bacterium]